MRGTARFGQALLLIALAAVGVAERVALHAHPLEENDLVPHPLVVVDDGERCDSRPHLDSAAVADHPVCVECVLAASAVGLAPSAPSRLAVGVARRLAAHPVRFAPVSAGPRAHGARGPPSA